MRTDAAFGFERKTLETTANHGYALRVEINTAPASELEQLPGIGGLAERIVAYREEHGPFRRVEHLMMVRVSAKEISRVAIIGESGMNPTTLQVHAKVFREALRAVDARAATRRALTLKNSLPRVGDTAIDIAGRPIYLVAIGKAADAMTAGLTDVLGERISRGIVCGPNWRTVMLTG